MKRVKLSIIIKSLIISLCLLVSYFIVSVTVEMIQEDTRENSIDTRLRYVVSNLNTGSYFDLQKTLLLYDCFESEFDEYWNIANTYNLICEYTLWMQAEKEIDNPAYDYAEKAKESKEEILRRIEKGKEGEYPYVFEYFESLSWN